MMDFTRLHHDFAQMQEHLTRTAEDMHITLKHLRQSIPDMQRIREEYSYVGRQIREWEDTIRQGIARTKQKNQRIDQFLKSTPTCPGDNCAGRLQKTERSEGERIKAVIGPQYDVKCGACNRIIYLPPVLYLTGNAHEYLRAARILRNNEAGSDVASVAIFLMHQAAELYLKGLGTCTLYDDREEDDDSEYIEGESLDYRPHNLPGLFQRIYPSLRDELEEYEKEQPQEDSVESLINAIPSQTAEMFRYGFLLRGQYGQITISGGDVLVEGKNISEMLLDLCARLQNFTRLRVLL